MFRGKEVLNIMKKILLKFTCPAVLLFFILTSCASTTMLSARKDEAYKGTIKNMLIIVISAEPGTRRVFEREYVFQLKNYGVNATPGYEILPDDKVVDKETILSKIDGRGIDSILITSLISKETVTTVAPGWYGHYSHVYGRRFTDDILNLETTLHDIKSDKMIWSAVSETVIMEGESSLRKIQPFVETILKNLSKDKLI